MDKILITGITSIHGWPIYQRFVSEYGTEVAGVAPVKMKKYFSDTDDVYFCNIEDKEALGNIFKEVSPRAVIHAGGVCDLDMCEDSPEFAYDVNVCGARNITELAGGSYLIYISSDLVFSGNIPPQGGYTHEHSPDPVSVVGRTYAAAEEEISKAKSFAILRIGLPIGSSLTGTKGAVDFIAGRLGRGLDMTLFHDEVRSLISTDELAEGVLRFFHKQGKGVYHFASGSSRSLYDIGRYIVDNHGYSQEYLFESSRHDEENGPPRIGDVSLDSSQFYEFTQYIPSCVLI